MAFTTDTNGYITGARFYKASTNTGTHVGSLWSATGTLLAQATFAGETASGWQQVSFSTPVAVTAGTTYVVSYYAPKGHYSVGASLTNQVNAPPLYALASANAPNGNGVFVYGSAPAFPTGTYAASNYFVDPVFSPNTVPTAPRRADRGHGGHRRVGFGHGLVERPDEQLVHHLLHRYPVRGVDGGHAGDGQRLPARHFDHAERSDQRHHLHLRRSSATSAVGTGPASAASNSATPESSLSCPCNVFGTQTPGTVDSGDGSAVNLGMAFTTDTNGYITGARFYKASTNTGTHVGSLWSATGTLLAQATFAGETASGWQQVSFSTPVAVTAGTTYVVSYYAPKGHYSVGASLTNQVNAPPLYALASANAPNGNGVFVYGSAPAFPTGTYAASNYFVDPVFSTAS